MKRVKTKEPFITKAHRVICKKPGEIINMPDEDYEEVKSKVIVIGGTENEKEEKKRVKLKPELKQEVEQEKIEKSEKAEEGY